MTGPTLHAFKEAKRLAEEAGWGSPGVPLPPPFGITGPALDDLREQSPIAGGHAYSLSRLHRVAGSPPGRDPRSWFNVLGGKLVLAIAEYQRNLDILRGMPHEHVPAKGSVAHCWFEIDTIPDGHDGFRLGDVAGTYTVAQLYAMHLDQLDWVG